ncbi:phospholipase D [Yersinia pestis]|uniref:phospholipase D n=1 Tax=Yersinia pestis TaxID=632 RepID=UPI00057896FA|nr:phospholipase D [Yersinia pestis]
MLQIDNVINNIGNYFHHLSNINYIRLLDTPHAWGAPFGKEIMQQSYLRQEEFAGAMTEVLRNSRYRCDISSLNSPDAEWRKVIFKAIDESLSKKMGRTQPTQYRFLFGQSPTVFMNGLSAATNGSPDFVAFKSELIQLIKERGQYWEKMPEIWLGRFFRIEEGLATSFMRNVYPDFPPINDTRMTWNHTKIMASDGTEALVGGHNMNMDLFRNYPPVHDVSIITHDSSAYGSQLYLNELWSCNSDLLKKEYFDYESMMWAVGTKFYDKPEDPLKSSVAMNYMKQRQEDLLNLHENFNQKVATRISEYENMEEYKKADRVLSVGKYWTGPNMEHDYQRGSEIMKEQLIKNAKRIIRISQQDLVSAWKKKWKDHFTCNWIIEALLENKDLHIHVVVSALDAAAGAAGDQYSFGSGAERTYELFKYYLTHDIDTDEVLDDPDGSRADALKRILIAPFFFTDKVPDENTIEGETYKWPDLEQSAYTATLKQKPLSEKPPHQGIIGSALMSAIKGSGLFYPKVPVAPGNHAKLMIIDDELYVVGSDNLYPGYLSEFDYLVEGKDAVNELMKSYWEPLWKYSSPHAFPKLSPN